MDGNNKEDQPSGIPKPIVDENGNASVSMGGMKVIQPLDPTLKPEVEVKPPQQVQANQNIDVVPQSTYPNVNPSYQPVQQQVQANANQVVNQTILTSNSIYPNPVQNAASNQSFEGTKESNSSKLLFDIVYVIGALIMIDSIVGAITWISYFTLVKSPSPYSVLAFLICIASFFLGLGIILKNESARVIYLFLCILTLVLTVISTITYVTVDARLNNLADKEKNSVQDQINSINNNSYLSPQEKTEEVKSLQTASKATLSSTSLYERELMELIINYVLCIIPLIVLTRPSVKEKFL
jgi:hypothetical protein